jgi:hypothetical protein
VDLNNDGICDYNAYADSNSDVICGNYLTVGIRPQDGTGRKIGKMKGAVMSMNVKRMNFIDANGDGVCDNCPHEGLRPQDGIGVQRGSMYGRSR